MWSKFDLRQLWYTILWYLANPVLRKLNAVMLMLRHFVIKLMEYAFVKKNTQYDISWWTGKNSSLSPFITCVFHWRRRGNDLLILLNVLMKSRLKGSYPAHYLIWIFVPLWQTYHDYAIVQRVLTHLDIWYEMWKASHGVVQPWLISKLKTVAHVANIFKNRLN